MVRKINEDACLEMPERGLWAVADGMGGHDAGDVASGLLVDTLRQVPLAKTLGGFVREVRDNLYAVNRRLREEASARGKLVIGCTAVALLAFGRHCVYLWAGDSRVYLWRRGRLRQLTRDHSQVAELVARGLLRAEDAEKHPAANVITRAVGEGDALRLDAEITEVFDGDVFLLCSDGLSKELHDADIANVLDDSDPEAATKTLIDSALEHGGRDNVTVVLVRFDAADREDDPENVSS